MTPAVPFPDAVVHDECPAAAYNPTMRFMSAEKDGSSVRLRFRCTRCQQEISIHYPPATEIVGEVRVVGAGGVTDV